MTDAALLWPLDPTTPESALAGLEAHAGLWDGADVVGVGTTARTVRELHVIAHGLVRLLVGRLGFRAVLVEGDRAAGEALDAFVCDGTGDPRATLAGARPFLATEELLALVLWLRQHNARDPGRGVRIVHGGADDLSSPAALERSLADPVTSWHERFGHRIVYLGGATHTAVIPERDYAFAPADRARTAGALLRDRFGAGYRSVGLTFGSGPIPQPIPAPAPSSLEARLDAFPHPTFLVAAGDLRKDGRAPAPDRLRFVGPHYDPDDDPTHSMRGAPTTWFDTIIHQRLATSATFLT